MWRTLRNWKLLAGVAGVAAILAVALWPEPIEVDLARASRGPLAVTIDEEGVTRVRERFVVSAPVAGRLQRIALEPGDPIRRNRTVLARLTPAPPALLDARTQAELAAGVDAARASVGQATAERERARAALARLQSSTARQRELAQSGVISRDELEAAEAGLRTAEEAVRAAEFTLNRAEYDLQIARARLQQSVPGSGTIEIVAPISGVVLKRVRESEAIVQAGDPLLEVGDPRQLEIVADLLSTDAVRVPPGARVLVEQWGGGHTLEGRVRRVEPSGFMKISALGVEEQRVNVIIDFVNEADASGALGDGFRVEVRIIVWEAPDVLKAPVGSLFRRGDDWAVFAVEDERARTRIVEIGRRSASEAEVIRGLDASQPIVLHPPDTLADGARIVERAAP
jgi:HlyD family secretion protein